MISCYQFLYKITIALLNDYISKCYNGIIIKQLCRILIYFRIHIPQKGQKLTWNQT